MKDGRELIEQQKANLQLGTKLETALVIAICEDNTAYWLKEMRVRPPILADQYPLEHIAEWLGRRVEHGGPLPPDWAKAPPRKS